ncbi:MAG: EFR1 family ferrodoxin [Candidatus Thorarchaeota archaeon]
MKFALLYFSGTGVTAKFAHDIASGIENNNHTMEFFRIKKNISIDVSQHDIVGIGSPAYSFRAPRLTTKFLKKINFQKKPFFIFCTSGGMPGNTLWNLFRAVKKTGGYCLGYLEGVGTTNLRSWMPEKSCYNTTLIGINSYYSNQAQIFVQIIIERYNSIIRLNDRKQRREWLPKVNILTILWSLLFTWPWQMALYVGWKKVDKNKCNHCGLCESKICPSGAIKLNKNKLPKFNELICVGCSGCVNLCPVDAIWTNNSRNKIQYNLYSKYIL